jgi:glycosyltransferase involved in cell wall biosynthesis
MQIAFIGNINNAPFLLAEAMREIGVNVRLLVTRSERLHHPVHAGLIDELPDWIHDASALGIGAFEGQEASIAPALGWVMHNADLAILNDTGPSLHNLLPVPVVSFLTGSDLTYYATLSSAPARRSGWSPEFTSTVHGLMDVAAWEEMVVRQRAGIRRSAVVCYPWRGLLPESDALLDEIGVADSKRTCLLNIDTLRVHATPVPPGQPLKIFNGARLNWVEPMPAGFSDQDHKGSDRLLRGFAQFLRLGGQGQLTLVEKGLHVQETRELALALGIDKDIVWKQEMSVRAFYGELEASHVVCCNLGKSIPGQAALVAMAAGRPALADFSPYAPHFSEPWPVCDARTPDEVAEQLWALYAQPELRQQIGSAARRFAETRLSPSGAARALLERLAATLKTAALKNEIERLRAKQR